jgi:hypothetical protein
VNGRIPRLLLGLRGAGKKPERKAERENEQEMHPRPPTDADPLPKADV